MGKPIRSFRDLDVWHRSMKLAEAVYRATTSFPSSETYGLTGQMRRAAVAVPSNIAEGWGRGSRGDYTRFLSIARGSLHELETQMELASRLNYLDADTGRRLVMEADEISRMLLSLIRAVRASQA